jgi:hypothetical protein
MDAAGAIVSESRFLAAQEVAGEWLPTPAKTVTYRQKSC